MDESGRVLGLYYKSDTTFLTRAPDPGAVMASLGSLTVGEVVQLQHQQQQTGESLSTSQGLMCTCVVRSSIRFIYLLKDIFAYQVFYLYAMLVVMFYSL